jgi:type IV pilus assembly protein PilZ
VDQVRELTKLMALTGHGSGASVAIVNPADMLTPSAANALLKTLEEPRPGATLIVLVTAVSPRASRRPSSAAASGCEVAATGPGGQPERGCARIKRPRRRGPRVHWTCCGDAPLRGAGGRSGRAVARSRAETEPQPGAARSRARLDIPPARPSAGRRRPGPWACGWPVKPGLLTLTIKDKSALYLAYMPFVQNGGLFIPTNSNYRLGDEVFMLLNLMGEDEKLPVAGRVIWVTPKGAQGKRTAGIGVQFSEQDRGQTRRRSRIIWPARSPATRPPTRCSIAQALRRPGRRFGAHPGRRAARRHRSRAPQDEGAAELRRPVSQ